MQLGNHKSATQGFQEQITTVGTTPVGEEQETGYSSKFH